MTSDRALSPERRRDDVLITGSAISIAERRDHHRCRAARPKLSACRETLTGRDARGTCLEARDGPAINEDDPDAHVLLSGISLESDCGWVDPDVPWSKIPPIVAPQLQRTTTCLNLINFGRDRP